ncbi:MAG TPA: type III secretion system inner membrane ring subunit SctD [Chlamydiales bacterium]|nr:type III secretion system inner membrane ring subunit SctD [Chlamydiales bacterium]
MPAHLIVEEGPLRGLLFPLDTGEEWILGRDPDESQFVVEDDAMDQKAARLIREADEIYIENLSSVNPVLINGEEIRELVSLKEGDRIQIGHTVFLFSQNDPANDADAPSKEEELRAPTKKRGKKAASSSNAHDTIFEDLDAEEPEIPFSLLSETPLLLKVVSGPNAGAEIGIEKGRSYTLGKDPAACDIVFQDLSVSRSHARLDVSSDGEMEIEDLNSKNGTVLNGFPIEEKTPLANQDMIAMGTTVFLVIDRGAPEETIYSPVALGRELPKEEAPVLQEAPPEEPLVDIEEKKTDWKTVPIPGKYLIAVSSFATIFLIVFLSFFSLFKSEQVEIVQKEPVSQIQKALAKYEDVQFSFNPASGTLFLVGHVLTAVDAEEMRFRIGEIGFIDAVEDNVVIDEGVNRTMNDVLSGHPELRGVVIQSPQAGKFVVLGYVDTNAEALQLSDYLTVNFPYLDRLENKIVIGEILNAQITALLQSKGFLSLTFQYVNGEIVLSGSYSNKMEKELKDLIKQIDQIKGVAGVKNYAVTVNPSSAAIDISDQYRLTGISEHDGKGFGAILNGKIYTLGHLVNGMTITEIDPTMILLEKDGIKYKINYMR